ncbi:chemotaxis protein CheX (plasmid) [Aneurinibacillus sp. Ricciae_BoGa-3]|uniref:chemotaxis protein CheX n=1 Tax=Aneurinibacillus sp. Ricciae_BoGa-3 TaxID=3022697 RepID=UPI002340BE90|nr:chemotaxis protein CheX [Aneurinibacillus sp. Ricciae_BoGa-3]WCK57241.1 chemotaxis protein CheX [Aneurinibacillus sp. Ricciae_BoGa-3]
MPLELAGTTVKNSPVASKDVVVMVGITGDIRGSVAINLDEEFAKQIASNMMGGMPVTAFDEIPKSAVSELSNMIMGSVCTAFASQGVSVDITPPSLLTGQNIQLTFSKLPLLSIKLKYQEFDVDFDISVAQE